MKIYDITQELFTGKVFPGDTKPSYKRVSSIENGAICNLSEISMCAHNGTHMDAPFHFVNNGKTIEQLELSKCIGKADVVEFHGELTAKDIEQIMKNKVERLLIKGDAVITLEAAKVMNQHHILLIGVEPQTVGTEESSIGIHQELLGHEVVIIEGLDLKEVPEGSYMLSAAPIKLGGLDGAPCRAVLISEI